MRRPDNTIKVRPPGQVRPYPKATSEGDIPFTIPSTGDKASTHYWLWGDFTKSTKIPLICLHGGPGIPHSYLLPISLIFADYGIPVIMYDQVGCGASTRFRAKKFDDSFFNPELYMAELNNLKLHLGIKTFDLLGQSWGGMLAGQYAITQPDGLHKVIIADSPASMVTWRSTCDRLRRALPEDVQETLTRCEKEGRTDSKEYKDAVQVFYGRHVCRLDPFPQELNESLGAVAEDNTVYETMVGPSEFYVTGSLKNWSIEDGLRSVTQRTVPGGMLLMNGFYDEAQDETMQPFFTLLSAKVKWVRFGLSAHCPQLDETEDFMVALGSFLTS